MVDSSAKILFQLLRTALGDGTEVSLPEGVDWKAVVDMAFAQGVAAMLVDGIDKATKTTLRPFDQLRAGGAQEPTKTEELDFLESEELEDLRYELFGEVLACEADYRKYQLAIRKLAGLYGNEGIDMLLMKGYGLSLNYPVPEHRTSGDIDIYLYGKGGLGDALVQKRFGCEVKQNEDKHSVFALDDISVENHACFVNDTVHPSLKGLNDFLMEEAKKGTRYTMGESQFVMPSAMFNALFIPFHCAGHFVHGESSIRQLCDWACFVMNYGRDIDWKLVREMEEGFGYFSFSCCLNGIVMDSLGVSSECLPGWPRNKDMEESILADILSSRDEVKSLFGKVMRFFSSRWRYRMVYNDSMLASSFRLAKS